MKKFLLITFTAVVLWCFAYSCAKQNDYDSYVETTGERFGTVEEQVAYLEGLLVTLRAEKAVLADYADSLEDAGDERAEVVDSLLEDLGKKMQAVDDSLKQYATKRWVDATFATLDAVKELSVTTAALEAKVKADSAAIAANITSSINASETELTEMFESYYKKADVDVKINSLTERLNALSDSVSAAKDSVGILETEVAGLKTSLKTIDKRLDSAVNALKKQDTVFMKQIDSLDKAYSGTLKTLSENVADNTKAITELEARVGKLELRIQSVEVVPDYIDGGVKMKNLNTNIKFEVRPVSAAKALVDKGVSAFSLQAMKVKAMTKAGSIYTTVAVQSVFIDAEDSLLVLKVKGSDMPKDFFDTTATHQCYSARLSINDGNTGKSTPYFPLTPYVVSYPEAPEENCIEINGLVWAPVNCGYGSHLGTSGDSILYSYGLLYQWGRKDGGGYNESIAPYNVERMQTYNTGGKIAIPDSSTFYRGEGNAWYSGTDPLWDVTGRSSYDPCPTGWRVPTKAELTALLGSHTTGDFQEGTGVHSGMKGKWFDGSAGAQGSGVFLPAAGSRSNETGYVSSRGGFARYWSSSVTDETSASALTIKWNHARISGSYRALGLSVRCVME